jgi:hypothetical protein
MKRKVLFVAGGTHFPEGLRAIKAIATDAEEFIGLLI